MPDKDWTVPPTDGQPDGSFRIGNVGPEGFEPEVDIEAMLDAMLAGGFMPPITIFDGIDPVTDVFMDFLNAAPPNLPPNVAAFTAFQLGVMLGLERPGVARRFIDGALSAGDGHNPSKEVFDKLLEDGEANDGPEANWKD